DVARRTDAMAGVVAGGFADDLEAADIARDVGERNSRDIVGAGDGDAHDLRGAVGGLHREAVAQRDTGGEALDRRVGVVERVAPVAGGVDGVAAVAAGAGGRRGHRLPAVGGVVDVGRVEVAGRGRRARRGVADAAGFGHRARGGAAD